MWATANSESTTVLISLNSKPVMIHLTSCYFKSALQIRPAPFIVDGCGSFGKSVLIKDTIWYLFKQSTYLWYWLRHGTPPRRSCHDGHQNRIRGQETA